MKIKSHLASVKQSFFPKLTRVWLEVSDVCNSHCKTCSAWRNTRSSNRLDVARVFGNPLFKDVTYILNSGAGEPSLSDLKNILLTEHKLLPKATLQVSTNGLLPEKVFDAVQSALDAGAKVDVGVSLDGIGKVHDSVRGVPGNFEKVTLLLDLLRSLNNSRLSVAVGSTLTDEMVKSAWLMKQYAYEHGAGFMWNWLNNSTSFYGDVSASDNSGAVACEVESYPDTPYFKRWKNYVASNRFSGFKCYALQSFCAIKCSGEMVPCLSHYNWSIGNVVDCDAEKVWDSKEAQQVRTKISKCVGCLNSWGCGWSLTDNYFAVLPYKIKNKFGVN